MRHVRQILQGRAGSAFPFAVSLTLVLLLIFCGISEYFRLGIIAEGVRDALQSAVIGAVNDNYDEAYHGIREGYAGGYQPVGDDFEPTVDYGDVYARLDSLLGLDADGDNHVKWTADGKVQFRLSNLRLSVQNIPIPTSDPTERQLQADGSITLEVPVSFAGSLLPPMRINLKTSAGYMALF